MVDQTFEGDCIAKSTFEGKPVGQDFFTNKVFFLENAFQGDKDNQFVQLNYGKNLAPGTHPLEFGTEGTPSLQYRNGQRLIRISGAGTVTIGEDLDTQVGSFKGTYPVEGGEWVFEGNFKAKRLE
ncbi:hypothetical protein [Pseudomonas koreensis]|uniref:hypothetical protein n=1 Tax=Pseudomonas koreensis TaxID=198620 RepID=UPI00147615B4|nr:hypothetical protein [Pseudomonas koreensis]NNA56874.1 hypothetical protein [Pseudomonas koreensis]